MMNSILDHIKEESVRKFGEVCDNKECGMHEKFCRCHKAEERANRRTDLIERNGNIMKRIFKILRQNTLSQMFLFGFIMFLTGILSNWFEWLYPTMIVSCVVLTVYILVFIIGGIVNFIKNLW